MSHAARFHGKPVDLVVDVRSKLEFWLGHLPGAVCIPVDRVLDGVRERGDISADITILVYCASGARSAAAAHALKAAGYRRVIDAGGIGAARDHYDPAAP